MDPLQSSDYLEKTMKQGDAIVVIRDYWRDSGLVDFWFFFIHLNLERVQNGYRDQKERTSQSACRKQGG